LLLIKFFNELIISIKNKLYIYFKTILKGGIKMKTIIIGNQLTCIGKINDIIIFLTELQNHYNTIKEYIEDKQKILRK